MSTCIATFFSHFGAIRFHRELTRAGLSGTLMPVPRAVSSSCGTCVRFELEEGAVPPDSEDVEALFRREADGSYTTLKNSL